MDVMCCGKWMNDADYWRHSLVVTLSMFIWIRNYIYFITGLIVAGSRYKLQLISLLP